MSFSIADKRTETTTVEYHTRSPVISFLYNSDGSQYIEVTLSEEKTVNGETISESIIDKVVLKPEELIGKKLVNPMDKTFISSWCDFARIDGLSLITVLYTIFTNALNKKRGVENE